jgi:hypothetical protein
LNIVFELHSSMPLLLIYYGRDLCIHSNQIFFFSKGLQKKY